MERGSLAAFANPWVVPVADDWLGYDLAQWDGQFLTQMMVRRSDTFALQLVVPRAVLLRPTRHNGASLM